MNKESFFGKITYQVIVNITTAVALFLIAAAFKTEVQELFDTVFSRTAPEVRTYPIYCTAEIFDPDPDRRELKLDFYIVNTKGEAYSETELRGQLNTANPDSSRSLKPRIELTLKDPATARYLQAASDAFNGKKGDITVSVGPDGREILIDIHHIERRAVLKATFLIGDMDFVSPRIERSVSAEALLLSDGYVNGCYSF